MSERINPFFRYNSMMREFNSAEIGHKFSFLFDLPLKCNNRRERGIVQLNTKIKIQGKYNTLPASSDCEPGKIFGNARNLFIQPLNFPVNVITDIGKMNDGTV